MNSNDDTIIEILLHLPVKSVLRFRSVCKSWCNMIDSSVFRKSHFHAQSTNHHNDDDDTFFLQFRESSWTLSSSALFPDNWRSYNEFPPDFRRFLNDSIKISLSASYENLIFHGPINGLVLVYNRVPDVPALDLESCLLMAICNPCLRETKFLPQSPLCLSLMDSFPSTFRAVGFGFDKFSNEYKVVQLLAHDHEERTYVEVYSGRTNTWKVVATDVLDDIYTYYFEIMAMNSVTKAYWQVQSGGGVNDNDEDVILSFDMHNEEFEIIKLPEFETIKYTMLYAKDDDCLVLFVCGYDCGRMEMWELRIERRRWSHVRDVDIGQLDGVWGRVALPLTLWKDGGLLLTSYRVRDHDDLLFKYWIFYEEESKWVELPKSRWEILEYKCTLYSLYASEEQGKLFN